MLTADSSVKSQKSIFENRIDQRLKDDKLDFYSSLYYSNFETTVIKVNLERAVLEYANSFKTYFDSEQTLNNNDYFIDLSKALFLDSTYLGAIIYCLKMANSRGADLSLIVDLNKVKILSHLKNLENIINVYPSLDVAIEQLKNSSN